MTVRYSLFELVECASRSERLEGHDLVGSHPVMACRSKTVDRDVRLGHTRGGRDRGLGGSRTRGGVDLRAEEDANGGGRKLLRSGDEGSSAASVDVLGDRGLEAAERIGFVRGRGHDDGRVRSVRC